MAIKPILFNTEMVRAILDGRKTCTRRIMKPQMTAHYGTHFAKPPYQPGDILYVRETWQYLYELDGNEQIIEGTGRYYYKASDTLPFSTYVDSMGVSHENIPWKPSIHMPKKAARIWLKVTDVRVERLQECGKGWCLEIEKEGVVSPQDPILYINDDKFHDALREEFENLWNSTIKKFDLDCYGWNANPWVWVIEFERCEKPEGV